MKGRLPLQNIVRVVGIILSTIIVILIILFSFMRREMYPKINWIPFADKGDHMAAYAALGFTFFMAVVKIPGSGKKHTKNAKPHSTLHITSWAGHSIIVTLVAGTAIGFVIEMLQPLFGRSREWLDLAADFMGLVIGIAVVLVLLKLLGYYFTTRPWLYDPNWVEDEDASEVENL